MMTAQKTFFGISVKMRSRSSSYWMDALPPSFQDYERYEKIQQGIDLWKALSYRIRNAEQGNTLSIDEAFEDIEANIS